MVLFMYLRSNQQKQVYCHSVKTIFLNYDLTYSSLFSAFTWCRMCLITWNRYLLNFKNSISCTCKSWTGNMNFLNPLFERTVSTCEKDNQISALFAMVKFLDTLFVVWNLCLRRTTVLWWQLNSRATSLVDMPALNIPKAWLRSLLLRRGIFETQ
jgi:hypothetical protein